MEAGPGALKKPHHTFKEELMNFSHPENTHVKPIYPNTNLFYFYFDI